MALYAKWSVVLKVGDKMKCPYCNRKPSDIPEYAQQAKVEDMTPKEYVRFREGTYHIETDLFCCTDCYLKIGMPLNIELVQAYRNFREYVEPLERG